MSTKQQKILFLTQCFATLAGALFLTALLLFWRYGGDRGNKLLYDKMTQAYKGSETRKQFAEKMQEFKWELFFASDPNIKRLYENRLRHSELAATFNIPLKNADILQTIDMVQNIYSKGTAVDTWNKQSEMAKIEEEDEAICNALQARFKE